jgi:uncharacterized membrane protein YeaQ/YmgE (transglycosylase-associated protein family)
MTIAGIVSAVIVGAIIGVLGRLVAPGRQNIGIALTVLVGICAALLGTFIVGPMRDTQGVDWVELLVQIVLAAAGVSLVAASRGTGGRRLGV